MNKVLLSLLVSVLVSCNDNVMSPDDSTYVTMSANHQKLPSELPVKEKFDGLCLCECTTGDPYDGILVEIEWLDLCDSQENCLLQCANYCIFEWPIDDEWWEVNNYECIDIGE